jgi:murein DD-endopeptidase MepM/ murein hydrolase activator NlpD
MANIRNIQEYGNQLVVLYDDGTKQMAYPTTGGLWMLAAPPVPPVPVNSLIWPYPIARANINMGYPEDGFHTAGRPNHEGMDWGMPPASPGAPNRACGAGTVIVSGTYQGYGQAVIIDHGTINGANWKTLQGHNIYGSLTKSVGDPVVQKETVGSIGNTGNSYGAHLHWETWKDGTKINPLIAMAELNPDNLDCTM